MNNKDILKEFDRAFTCEVEGIFVGEGVDIRIFLQEELDKKDQEWKDKIEKV